MNRGSPGRRLAFALAWMLMLAPATAYAQYITAPVPSAYALHDVTLVRADGTRQAHVNIVVRGDLIEAIGTGVRIPADARVLEGDSLLVYPGIVDAQGAVAYELPKQEADRAKIPAWNAPRWAQGFQPHRRLVEYITAIGKDLSDQRRKGVVAAAVHPADAMMPGRGAFLLFRPEALTPEGLVARPELGPVMTFRGARGFYPATLFGVIATIRQSYLDAERDRRIAAAQAEDARGVAQPAYDPDYAVLRETKSATVPVFFTANDASDIGRVIALSDEIGFHPVIVGGAEAWRMAPELRARNIPVLVSLDFPKPKQWKPPVTGTPDSAAAKPDTGAVAPQDDAAVLREKARLEAMYANPGRLAKAGVRFALTSGGGKAEIREGARKAMEYGLSEVDALRAVTATPAALLGAPQIARIERGLPATFVVTTGPLFARESKIAYAFVEGALEKGDTASKPASTRTGGAGAAPAPAASIAGVWEGTVRAAEEMFTFRMELRQNGSAVEGTISSEIGEATITSGSLDGARLQITARLGTSGGTAEITMTGEVEGGSMHGDGKSPDGTFTWTATRTTPPGESER